MSEERNGNSEFEGATARHIPTLPSWPKHGTPEDVRVTLASTLAYLHEVVPQLQSDIEITKGAALAASGNAASAREASVNARYAIEALTRRLDDTEGSMRERFARMPSLIDEAVEEKTGRHDLLAILEAHDLKQAQAVVDKQRQELEAARADERKKSEAEIAKQEKKRSEWRTGFIGSLFVVVVFVLERLISALHPLPAGSAPTPPAMHAPAETHD